MEHLTKEEATQFFGKLFGGEHHLTAPIRECGFGWSYTTTQDFSTYDFNRLTQFVVLCHDECIRGDIQSAGPRRLRLSIWKRQREGDIMKRHPTMEDQIKTIREHYNK